MFNANTLNIVLFIVILLVPAVVLHELAHGAIAFLLGDTTARDRGRLSLSPIRHLDPVGSVLIPAILYFAHLPVLGMAKPVPVNFGNLRPQRLGMALVALGGPLTNIALAFIFSRLYAWPALSNGAQICAWGVMLNLTLAVFNMMPIPPLDGSRVVTSILPAQLAFYYNRLERFGMIIILGLLYLGAFRFLMPLIYQVGQWMGMPLYDL